LDDVYPFVNTVALFRGQWQFKKQKMSDAEYQRLLEDKVQPLFETYKARLRDEGILRPQVVYGYFPCQSDGDALLICDPDNPDKGIERFTWPRQPTRKRLCVSDFFRDVESGEKDVIGLSLVTMGPEATKLTRKLYAE